MGRTSYVSLGVTLVLLLPAKPAPADPIGITVGFVSISGVQDVESRGFLRSISYSLQVGDLRLADADPDYLVQDVFAPKFPVTLWWMNDDATGEVVYLDARLAFSATPGLLPSEFTMAGWLKLVSLADQTTVFDQAVSGYGTATWEFVTRPEGGQVVSGVTYDFHPVPEPAGLLLLGSGLSALAVRRWRGRRALKDEVRLTQESNP